MKLRLEWRRKNLQRDKWYQEHICIDLYIYICWLLSWIVRKHYYETLTSAEQLYVHMSHVMERNRWCKVSCGWCWVKDMTSIRKPPNGVIHKLHHVNSECIHLLSAVFSTQVPIRLTSLPLVHFVLDILHSLFTDSFFFPCGLFFCHEN
jgi:hypothetical protein